MEASVVAMTSAALTSLAASVPAILLVVVVSADVETSGKSSGMVMATATRPTITLTIHIHASDVIPRLRIWTAGPYIRAMYGRRRANEDTIDSLRFTARSASMFMAPPECQNPCAVPPPSRESAASAARASL